MAKYSEFKSSVQCTVCMKHIAWYQRKLDQACLLCYDNRAWVCTRSNAHPYTMLGDDDDHNNYDGDHVFIAIIRNNLSFLCHPSFLSMEFQTSIVRRQNWYCHCVLIQVKVFLKLCWALATGIINHHPPERNMLSIFGQSSPTSWSGRS